MAETQTITKIYSEEFREYINAQVGQKLREVIDRDVITYQEPHKPMWFTDYYSDICIYVCLNNFEIRDGPHPNFVKASAKGVRTKLDGEVLMFGVDYHADDIHDRNGLFRTFKVTVIFE